MFECVQVYGYGEIVKRQFVYTSYSQSFHSFKNRNSEDKEIVVVVASEKLVKINAMKELFSRSSQFKDCRVEVQGIKTDSMIAEQPIGIASGRLGALNRINSACELARASTGKPTYYCAIENYFEEDGPQCPRDHAFVIIRDPEGRLFEFVSHGIRISSELYKAALQNASREESGYSETVGAYLHRRYGVNSSDWFSAILPSCQAISRLDQILTIAES